MDAINLYANAMMTERGILFSEPMIQALLAGSKTQTRRIVKPQPNFDVAHNALGKNISRSRLEYAVDEHGGIGLKMAGQPVSRIGNCMGYVQPNIKCKYGKPGDRLYVKEPWQAWTEFNHLPPSKIPEESGINYLANGNKWDARVRSAIHMPRWASRITLEIVDVRVERLQEISEADAIAEGIVQLPPQIDKSGPWWTSEPNEGGRASLVDRTPQGAFKKLWESIKGRGSWDANPFVWVLEFERT